MPGISDSGLEMKTSHTFPSQLQTSNDPRFQLLMQQNMPSHQNVGFAEHVQDAFNPMNDNYLASRLIPQNHGSLSSYTQMSLQQPRSSHLTNGHWDGWGDLRQGNNVSMPDMSRMLYPTEANNFHMLGSNDLYNRAFGLWLSLGDATWPITQLTCTFLSSWNWLVAQAQLGDCWACGLAHECLLKGIGFKWTSMKLGV